MEDCIFCKIIKGEIPCSKVYEDDDTLAFLDIAPATPEGGHTLVIPKKHYELLTDVPEDEMAKLMASVQKVLNALLKISEGSNVLQNNKKVSGQLVPHVHFHIIPRYTDDAVTVAKWKPHEYKEGDMEKMQQKIKENI